MISIRPLTTGLIGKCWCILKRRLVQRSVLASDFNCTTSPKFNFNITKQNVGLFGIPELTDHTGFHLLKERVEQEVDELVQEVVADPGRSRKVVQIFDELSNCLCRVADMSDFIQVAHPDKNYRHAAEQTCVSLATLVEKLNTNTALYGALKTVVEEGDRIPTDAVDHHVAKLFLIDFEQSGIHLDDNKRKTFLSLNESVLMLGSYFSQAAHQPAVIPVSILPEHVAKGFAAHGNTVTLTGFFHDHPDSDVREAAYRLYLQPDEHRIELLESLLSRRHELAELVEFPTYAHRALSGTLGESPEKVSEFLEALSTETLPRALADYKQMLGVKECGSLNTGQYGTLQPWDHPYLAAVCRQQRWCVHVQPPTVLEVGCGFGWVITEFTQTGLSGTIAIGYNVRMSDVMPYLSLGCCMEGLNNLFRQLFRVCLQKVEPEEGEVWHHDIHKLAVIEEDTSSVLGYIFCDFFERADKPNQDCHFTIRGGRESSDGSYQLPMVVLFLNFPSPTSNLPSLLTPGMVDNLFHEFGHAMHSMLGRTKYQHVTGTRCPTDFAEVPALLMEYFVQSEKVVTSFARHYKTGEPMPPSVLEKVCHSKKLFAASDMQLQIFYSILDQQYHSARCQQQSSTDILKDVQNQYYGIPYAQGTAWQTRFNHLVAYGAKYYAYLMARAVAARIWHKCFSHDPFNRDMGERYRHEMLQHGGGWPPQSLIQGMLGEKVTVDGLVASLVDDIRR